MLPSISLYIVCSYGNQYFSVYCVGLSG